MRTAKMAFDIKISDNVAKLMLSGDIDLQVSGDIKSEIERLRDVDRLEIDASEVTYIDSSGVAVLILARQYCAQNNMALALPSISEAVHRVLQLAKLDVMLPLGEVVSAPEPEEFSFDAGADAFDSNSAVDDGFGSDDDLVNSLLSDDDMTDGTIGTGASVENNDLASSDLAGGDLASGDLASGDFASGDLAGEDHSGDSLGGDFEGLDVSAVDFSEPATATTSAEDADEDPDPKPDSDALKPGTFS